MLEGILAHYVKRSALQKTMGEPCSIRTQSLVPADLLASMIRGQHLTFGSSEFFVQERGQPELSGL